MQCTGFASHTPPARSAAQERAATQAGACERQGIAADVARKPGPPAGGENALSAKARDALEPRKRERVAAAFFGQIEIGNDDDEFAHDGVF